MKKRIRTIHRIHVETTGDFEGGQDESVVLPDILERHDLDVLAILGELGGRDVHRQSATFAGLWCK